MKASEFNRIIKTCSVKGVLSVERVRMLAEETRKRLVEFLVRARAPIVKEMIPDTINLSWLRACGYLYTTKGARFTFVHSCEHSIR